MWPQRHLRVSGLRRKLERPRELGEAPLKEGPGGAAAWHGADDQRFSRNGGRWLVGLHGVERWVRERTMERIVGGESSPDELIVTRCRGMG